jgi:hypothetical protein
VTIQACDQPVILAASQEIAQAPGNAQQFIEQVCLVGQGTLANPGAGANIAQRGVTVGAVYLVQWTVTLIGTVTSADANNMQLSFTGLGTTPFAYYPGAVGTYPQLPLTIQPATATLKIQSIAAGSGASATYGGQIIATPQAPPIAAAIPPSGYYLPAGQSVTLHDADEVWLAAVAPSLGRVSVMVARTRE